MSLRPPDTATLRRGAGVALLVAGSASWAWTVAVHVPAVRGLEARLHQDPSAPPGLSPDDLVALFGHGVRWSVLLVALCGLALVAAPRSWRSAVPLGLAAAAFLAADGVFGRLADPGIVAASALGREKQLAAYAGPAAAGVAFAVVVALAAAAWAGTVALSRREPPAPTRAFPLAVMAVAAAFAAPFASEGVSQHGDYITPLLPTSLVLLSQVAAVALAAGALACALAASSGDTATRAARVAVVAVVVGVPLAATSFGQLNGTARIACLGPLLVGVASVAWAGPHVRPWGVTWLDTAGNGRWLALLGASAVASFPLSVLTVGGLPATAALLGISGGAIGADGLPGLVSAAFAVGLGAGWLLDAGRAPAAPARPAYPDAAAHAALPTTA